MLINKITTGFVIQQWDTEKHQWVSQEFVAGDECVYENRAGETENDKGEPYQDMLVDPADGAEPYLPYDMVQPQAPVVPSAGCPCGEDH